MALSRRDARECALKVLYGYEFSKCNDADDFFDFTCAEGEIISDDFSKKLFLTTVANVEEIDETIEKYLKGWKKNRISKITLSVLRMCVCEMKYFDDIPAAVSMNEAVELAKKFDDDDAPKFVNGIANSVSKELK